MGSIDTTTATHALIIGQVAEQARVNIQTLRYYERRGLIPKPQRSASNYRLYPADTVRRVRFIKRGQELGFSLDDIRELLELRATPRTRCAQVRRRAETRLHDIDEKIRVLRSMRRSLTEIVAECTGRGPVSTCPILRSMDPDPNHDT